MVRLGAPRILISSPRKASVKDTDLREDNKGINVLELKQTSGETSPGHQSDTERSAAKPFASQIWATNRKPSHLIACLDDVL
jgi:hypothetical protein